MDPKTEIRISIVNGKEQAFAKFLDYYYVPTIKAMNSSANVLAVLENRLYVRYQGVWTHVITLNLSTKRYFIVVANFLEILSYVQQVMLSEVDPSTLGSNGNEGQLLFFDNSIYIYADEQWQAVVQIDEVEGKVDPPSLSGELSLAELENRTVLLVSHYMREIIPVFIGTMKSTLDAEKNVPGGVASLGDDGKVLTSQLPDVMVTGDISWLNL